MGGGMEMKGVSDWFGGTLVIYPLKTGIGVP